MPADVEVVSGLIEAYNRRDREAVAALLHPDIEWHTIAGPVIGTERLQGSEAVLDFLFQLVPEVLDGFRVEVDDLSPLPDGGHVLEIGRYVARGSGSGADVEMPHATIYRVQGGLIAGFHDFPTREEALDSLR